MKTNLAILIIYLFLISCTKDFKRDIKRGDSIGKNKQLPTEIILPKSQNSKLRSLDYFELKTGNLEIDSFINYKNYSTYQISKEYCWGDCCGANKTIIDSQSKRKIYIFKSDCGEYGFGNDEYIFQNDTLTLVRNFMQGIESFPNANTKTIFLLKEQISYLEPKRTLIKIRKREFSDVENGDSMLNSTNFKISQGDYVLTLKNKLEEFEGQIKLEKEKE